MEAFTLIVFVVLQTLFKPLSMHMVELSGYTTFYFAMPLILETFFLNHVLVVFRHTKLNSLAIFALTASIVNYLAGTVFAVLYDLFVIDAIDLAQTSIGYVEMALGMFMIALAMLKATRSKV